MPQLDGDVVITDGCHQYFRPSIYKMEQEVKYEVPDYKKKTKESILNKSYEDLTLVNQSYDRLCYVRKRLHEMKCSSNPNMVDIMVLLGIEHKLMVQIQDANEFITHYTTTIHNMNHQLHCFKSRLKTFFCCNSNSIKRMNMMQNIAKDSGKLHRFEKEEKDLQNLFHYIQGKILFLTDNNITTLDLLKE